MPKSIAVEPRATAHGARIARSAAPLREQAVIVIRTSITSGTYGPGERLTEASLCEALGVSRTVVREALRQLEAERLIEIVPNVGPVVRRLDVDEVRHLYEVRRALESVAAEMAAVRATPIDIAGLRGIVRNLESSQLTDIEEVVSLKDDFYELLVKASDNPVIGDMLENIHARSSQLRRRTLSADGRRIAMLAELTAILDAIEVGDADAAARATRVHVQIAEDIALRGLDATEAR